MILAGTKIYLLAVVVLVLLANLILLVLPCSVRCAVISIAEGQRKYNYQCGIMEGRFVHVVLPGLQKNLTVCEVRVYGTLLGKLHTP